MSTIGSSDHPPNSGSATATPSSTATAPAAATAARLDIERLDVYATALEFHSVGATLVPSRGQGPIRNQLERASLSIVLNTAEAIARVSPADKARMFAIARGSASECAAVVDVLRIRGLVSHDAAANARALLVRIVQMLTALIRTHNGGRIG